MIRILTRLMGNRYFHSRVNNWSILNLGKVHLNHIITQMIKKVFPMYHTNGGMKSMMWLNPAHPPMWNGIHPPRKTVVAIAETTIIFVYSARKKKANFMALYSV